MRRGTGGLVPTLNTALQRSEGTLGDRKVKKLSQQLVNLYDGGTLTHWALGRPPQRAGKCAGIIL